MSEEIPTVAALPRNDRGNLKPVAPMPSPLGRGDRVSGGRGDLFRRALLRATFPKGERLWGRGNDGKEKGRCQLGSDLKN